MSKLLIDQYVQGENSVSFCPSRGLSVSSLVIGGREIFYADSERRNDPTKTLREGFWMRPQAGMFSQEQNEYYGYALKQHGCLRDMMRTQCAKNEYMCVDTQASLTQFPYAFCARQKIFLEDEKCTFVLSIKNTDTKSMMCLPGHHTYYKVPFSQKKYIELSENMGVSEYMKKKWLSGMETICIPNPGICEVFFPGIGAVSLAYDPQFRYLRLRTEYEKDFVCIEPVVGNPSDRGSASLVIQPQEEKEIWFSICVIT